MGMIEMFRFYQKASRTDVKKMERLLKGKAWKKAWSLLKTVTGVMLRDTKMEGHMDVTGVNDLLREAMWSGKVKTKWHPPEGFFKQGAGEIASGLKSASDSLRQAMSRLNFYVNRAGDNLNGADRKRLSSAKSKLEKLYA